MRSATSSANTHGSMDSRFYDQRDHVGFLRTLVDPHHHHRRMHGAAWRWATRTWKPANGSLTELVEQFPQLTSVLWTINTKKNDTIYRPGHPRVPWSRSHHRRTAGWPRRKAVAFPDRSEDLLPDQSGADHRHVQVRARPGRAHRRRECVRPVLRCRQHHALPRRCSQACGRCGTGPGKRGGRQGERRVQRHHQREFHGW